MPAQTMKAFHAILSPFRATKLVAPARPLTEVHQILAAGILLDRRC